MPSKPAKKPKLTDAQRHKRFVDMAREVEADERPEAFDKAFGRIVGKPLPQGRKGSERRRR